MPRTRLRRSPAARLASSCARSMMDWAAPGSDRSRARARPRSSARFTSCGWSPSCRSRSIRLRSASAEATASERAWLSRATSVDSWLAWLGPSSHRPSAASASGTPRTTAGQASSPATPVSTSAAVSAGVRLTGPSAQPSRYYRAGRLGGEHEADDGRPPPRDRAEGERAGHEQPQRLVGGKPPQPPGPRPCQPAGVEARTRLGPGQRRRFDLDPGRATDPAAGPPGPAAPRTTGRRPGPWCQGQGSRRWRA